MVAGVFLFIVLFVNIRFEIFILHFRLNNKKDYAKNPHNHRYSRA